MSKQPAPKQVTMSFDCTVETDLTDFRIVRAYLEHKSLREVARLLLVSHETVSNAIDRYISVMDIALVKSKRAAKTTNI